MWLGAFLRCERYGSIERLAHFRMLSGFRGGGALLYVQLSLIKSWFELSICRPVRNTAVDPMLALVLIGRLTETD